MVETHIAEYFKKSPINSNSFLTDIWHETVLGHLLFINDFVENKSHHFSSITKDEVRSICRNNAKYSLRRSTRKEDAELRGDCSNIIKQDIKLQHATTCQKYDIPMFFPLWTPETLISDDLLDSFVIPPGNKRERHNTFYKNAKILYNYLCYCIGSERNVKLRRWFVQKKFIKNPWKGVTCEVIGSKSEGLDMKGSDTDILFIVDNLGTVSEHTALSPLNEGSPRIQYKSSNLSPGYVLIEITENGECLTLPSSLPKDFGIRLNRESGSIWSTKAHGPAFEEAPFGQNIDKVLAFKIETWPEIANEWIVRERKFGWPSQKIINDIVNKGCCIVPVGSKATNKTHDREWRLSFALVEKDLIFSFNHTQLLVYGLLKLILKEVINTRKEVSELLCSYFLKTTLFWIIEETHASLWKPQLIILCFQQCIERLIQFIVDDNCPNYFVCKNNMFSGKFSNKSAKEKLLQILCGISGRGFSWILESKTMCKLKSYIEKPSKMHELRQSQKVKDLREVTCYVFDLLFALQMATCDAYGLRNNFSAEWLKSLLEVPIVKTSFRQEICHFINYLDTNHTPNDNKRLYNMQKLHLFLLCAGCNSDLVVGILLLASCLYNNGKFIESLEFADLAFEFSGRIVPHCCLDTMTEFSFNFRSKNDFATEVDFIKHARRFRKRNVTFYKNSCLLPSEIKCAWRVLKIFFEVYEHNVKIFAFSPEAYCHFLRFLCLYRLGEIERSHAELIALDSLGPDDNLKNAILRCTGNMIENKIDIEWLGQQRNKLDIIPDLVRCFEGINILRAMNYFQNLGQLGFEPSILERILQQTF